MEGITSHNVARINICIVPFVSVRIYCTSYLSSRIYFPSYLAIIDSISSIPDELSDCALLKLLNY